jgi:putative redox protein
MAEDSVHIHPGDEGELEGSLKDYKSKVETVSKATLVWDKELIFLGRTQRGYEVDFDADKQWGCSPTETLLLSVAGCMGIDCVVFLQKMRVQLTAFKVDISGARRSEPPQYYTSFDIKLHISGKNLSERKILKAIALSQNKYCSVYHSLRSDVRMNVEYALNEES